MTETNYIINGCPSSIAFLADTHDTAPEPILASLRSRSPALIVHTGDFLHGWKQQSGVNIAECHNALNLLRSCVELAPTFLSIGNHESYLSGNDSEIIRSTGVTFFKKLSLGDSLLDTLPHSSKGKYRPRNRTLK